jgi:hypothetical protein
VGLSMLHAMLSMNFQTMNGTSSFGLLLAMGALVLLLWQVMIGTSLSRPTENRRSQRRSHFALMVGIVVLGAGHILLNSVLVRLLIH